MSEPKDPTEQTDEKTEREREVQPMDSKPAGKQPEEQKEEVLEQGVEG